jgi:hypothetical protein
MAAKIAPILDADGRRLCGLCRTRPVSPRYLQRRIYQCYPCHTVKNDAPAARYRLSNKARAAQARYRQTTHGRMARREQEARRIKVGRTRLGFAATREQAAAINSHIRRRLDEFRSAQRDEAF